MAVPAKPNTLTLAYTGKEFLEFAETCMAEYDVDGWKAEDLVNTGERDGPA